MKQVEKDEMVQGVLREELKRSREMLDSLEKMANALPRGSIHIRRKQYKDRIYQYYHLKYWDKGRSISKHIKSSKVDDIEEKLERRKSYDKEIKVYKKRIAYLEKVLRKR